MEIIIVALFLVYISYREWQHHLIVKSLTNKLMARSPAEYARYNNIDNPPAKEKPEPDQSEEYEEPLDVDVNEALKGIAK